MIEIECLFICFPEKKRKKNQKSTPGDTNGILENKISTPKTTTSKNTGIYICSSSTVNKLLNSGISYVLEIAKNERQNYTT